MKIFIAQLNSDSLPHANADQTTLNTILTFIFVTIGALALLMIIIGGLRYIMAQGDPQKVAEAKNMLTYSLIGLVLAASASVIVNYVIGKS